MRSSRRETKTAEGCLPRHPQPRWHATDRSSVVVYLAPSVTPAPTGGPGECKRIAGPHPRTVAPMPTAPYGSWASPISLDDLTAGSTAFSAVRIDGDSLYWLEAHPDQAGRTSLWRRDLAAAARRSSSPQPRPTSATACTSTGAASTTSAAVSSSTPSSPTAGSTGSPTAPPPYRSRRWGRIDMPTSRCIPSAGWRLPCERTTPGPAEPVNTIVAIELDESRRR